MVSKTNRDVKRVNKADATLKANVLSLINRECSVQVKSEQEST